MMALNYGVGAEHTAPHKGYSDFVQQAGPVISGQLRSSLGGAQTLRVTFGYSQAWYNSFGVEQTLCADFIGMQIGRNLLMGHNYSESRELAKHEQYSGSEVPTKSTGSWRDGADLLHEKGRTANATLWDDCFFNHEENQHSPVLDDGRKPNLAYEENQYFAEPQDNHTEISGEVKPWRRGVLQKFRKTSTGATYKTFVGDRVTGSKPVQPSGSSLAFLRCSAFSLRPQASSTQAEKLAPGYSAFSCSTLASISSISSCGNLIFFCADLALMDFVAIAYPFVDGAGTPYIKGMDKKRLTCGPTDNMVGVHLDCIKMENSNAPECGNTAEASNHNVNKAYTMACQHSTQTRPKFVYLFLASYPSGGKPIMLRTEANSELEARLRVAGDYSLTFAAQIRTESPCVIHRYCEESDLTSTYICNKADAHPVCNAGKNSFCENPYQPRPEAHHV